MNCLVQLNVRLLLAAAVTCTIATTVAAAATAASIKITATRDIVIHFSF